MVQQTHGLRLLANLLLRAPPKASGSRVARTPAPAASAKATELRRDKAPRSLRRALKARGGAVRRGSTTRWADNCARVAHQFARVLSLQVHNLDGKDLAGRLAQRSPHLGARWGRPAGRVSVAAKATL